MEYFGLDLVCSKVLNSWARSEEDIDIEQQQQQQQHKEQQQQ